MSKLFFIDASNMTGAGAEVVGINLLRALSAAAPGDKFFYYLPDTPEFRDIEIMPNCEVVYRKCHSGYLNNLARLLDLHYGIPKLVKRFQPDVCLTLGDIGPLRLHCKHVVFVHQPMLISSNADLSGVGSWSPYKRMYLTWHFAASLNNVSRLIVQTPVMAEHIASKFSFDTGRISVIPQPVPDHVTANVASGKLHPIIAGCRKPVKLLFLARYYLHKNHSILPSVLEEINRRGMQGSVQIFTTVEEGVVSSVDYLRNVCQQSDLVTNLDTLPMSEVASALRSSTALFLPTLAESYGLIYLEAMSCGVPVLTSDRDFARWMCKDLAHYFDPMDPVSIVDSIEALTMRPIPCYATRAKERIAELPRDWKDLADAFIETLHQA